jgi:hypothetical protein
MGFAALASCNRVAPIILTVIAIVAAASPIKAILEVVFSIRFDLTVTVVFFP